jgi:hypothetical protein
LVFLPRKIWQPWAAVAMLALLIVGMNWKCDFSGFFSFQMRFNTAVIILKGSFVWKAANQGN